jgi:hypothetical protein
LVGDVQASFESGPSKRGCHGGPGIGGAVALLTQMGQHHDAETGMVELFQELRRGAVGEVSPRSGDPPLHHRRIIAGPQLQFIVIRLEHDRRQIAEQVTHPCRGATQIVGHADAGTVRGANRDREWVECVVTDGARLDHERRQLDGMAQAERTVFGIG